MWQNKFTKANYHLLVIQPIFTLYYLSFTCYLKMSENLCFLKSSGSIDETLAWDVLDEQKQQCGVFIKRCSENMQQIYRRTLIPKCDFNKVVTLLRAASGWSYWSNWQSSLL